MPPVNTTQRIHPESSPQQVLQWIFNSYQADQVVLTTSFGMEGCALIDLVAKTGIQATVADIDTGFLFEETKQLRKTMVQRYASLNFETWHPDLTADQQARFLGDELWKRDPGRCCHLRKVQPLQDQIGRFQIWITGIRKSQSRQRSDISPVQWDWQNNLLKVCPFANWERSDVWQYIESNGVPYNPLHHEGYPSIGCTHCTRKVKGLVNITDYSREGRWSGQEKTECGLHFGGQTCGAKTG